MKYPILVSIFCVFIFSAGCNNKSPSSKKVSVPNSDSSVLSLDMDQKPKRFNALGQPVLNIQSPFSAYEIANGDFILIKSCSRKLKTKNNNEVLKCVKELKACLEAGRTDCDGGKSAIEDNDRPEYLLGSSSLETNIKDMVKKDLTRASLPVIPWSDDYWPLYRGVLAARYSDSSAPESKNWKVNFEYSNVKNPISKILMSGSQKEIDQLSPSEKYDLLIGLEPGEEGSLTADMWRQGQVYFEEQGKVEEWMGICHGWAPAAYKVERPVNSVEVLSADGNFKIKFYAQDIRALASYLWATSEYQDRTIGGRCNTKKPKKDSNGRVADQDCFDTNPGAWHISVVNKIGIKQESFIMDATFDYEVWNQPVYSYSYKYFNPNTNAGATKLENAIVAMDELKKDLFKKYRSPDAKYLVGVKMRVSYIKENDASRSLQKDNIITVEYEYDLELDSNYEIIGGEWRTNLHPDFLWTSADDKPNVYEDRFAAGGWNLVKPLSESWQSAAQSAAENGQVLGKIVNALVKASKE